MQDLCSTDPTQKTCARSFTSFRSSGNMIYRPSRSHRPGICLGHRSSPDHQWVINEDPMFPVCKKKNQAPSVSAAVRRGGSSISAMPQSGFPESAFPRDGAPPHTHTRHFHGVISCQRWASPGRWTRSTPRECSPSIT